MQFFSAKKKIFGLLKFILIFVFVFGIVLNSSFFITQKETTVFAEPIGSELTDEVLKNAPPPSSTCSGWTDYITDPECLLAGYINLQLKFVGLLLFLAGVMFNYSIVYSITEMADKVDSIKAIGSLWGILRDISNMTFIFIMLYISIGTILGLTSVDTKKLIRNVILAALLINFSLFFTKVIVDASNILATGIYNNSVEISGGGGLDNKKFGMSGAIMQGLSLTSIYDVSTGKATSTGARAALSGITGEADLSTGGLITGGIMGTILILITSFVFFAGALLLIIRFAVLVLLMAVSPIAYVAMILPKTANISSMWWKTLINQAFFAPVFMLMLYIAVVFINDDSLKTAFTEEGGAIATLVHFTVSIIFVLLSIVIAKKMGAMGADFSQKWAAKASFGVAGWAGRNTLGRLGLRATESKLLAQGAESNNVFTRSASRLVLKAGDKAYKGSFDMRGTEALKNLNLGGTKLSLDKAQKGGYEQEVKDYTKKQESFAKILERAPETEKEKAMKETANKNLDSYRADVAGKKEKLKKIQEELSKNQRNLDEEEKKDIRSQIDTLEADLKNESLRESAKQDLRRQINRLESDFKAKKPLSNDEKKEREAQLGKLEDDLKEAKEEEKELIIEKARADSRKYRFAESLESEFLGREFKPFGDKIKIGKHEIDAEFAKFRLKKSRKSAAKELKESVTKGIDKKLKDVLKEMYKKEEEAEGKKPESEEKGEEKKAEEKTEEKGEEKK